MTDELIPLEWHYEKRHVRDLIPLDYNPRFMDEAGRARLTHSLQKFNLVDTPVINTDNVVVSGHQRLAVLFDLNRGDELIDVRVPNRQLTKDEIDEYNITANVGAGQWDYQGLLDNFSHLQLDNLLDLPTLEHLTALSVSQLPPAEEQDFDPAPTRVPISVLGDVYEFSSDGRGLVHRLICGSSTETDVVATLLEGVLIKLTVTDPPYNVKYEGGTKEALTILNDSMDAASFYQFLLDSYSATYAHMAPGAPIYVFHADSEGAAFRVAFKEAGFKYSQSLVWVKQSFVLCRQDYHWQHEPVLVGTRPEAPEELQEVLTHEPIMYGWKEGKAHPWYSDRKQSTVLKFDRPTRNDEHPTMKPVPMLEYLIECSSKIDDVVYDGFGGSGSLLIACEKTQRSCRAVELDPRFVDVHVRRYIKFMRENQRRFTISRNGQELTDEQLDAYLTAELAA